LRVAIQWRAQTTRGAAGKAGGGRLVERPARLAKAGWGWWIASHHRRIRFYTDALVVKNTISR